jgi:D-alanyl-lipoteichoic acid acyltransferase DltB (MBOAT superfamily)
MFLYRMNWAIVPLPLEHVLKVSAVVSAVVLLTNAMAAVYRLLGGVALDFMRNPLIASTPADFWRRWNVPAQQFLNEYAFTPAGGPRRAVRATLVTFAISGVVHEYVFGIAAGRVQGWQLLFFMLQGVAVVATMRIRPRGRITLLWIAGTWVFDLASSVLFFQSVNQVLPFYRIRDS